MPSNLSIHFYTHIGDLHYFPGHVMMYLGMVEEEPYMIHDISGLRYINENGDYHGGVLHGVSVTPLTPLHISREATYLQRMYAIKNIK